MAKEFAKQFYGSKAWKDVREYMLTKSYYCCEICVRSRNKLIVHHKIYLTPDNINDTNITLNTDNLQVVCKACHDNIHDYCNRKTSAPVCIFDKDGNVIGKRSDDND